MAVDLSKIDLFQYKTEIRLAHKNGKRRITIKNVEFTIEKRSSHHRDRKSGKKVVERWLLVIPVGGGFPRANIELEAGGNQRTSFS